MSTPTIPLYQYPQYETPVGSAEDLGKLLAEYARLLDYADFEAGRGDLWRTKDYITTLSRLRIRLRELLPGNMTIQNAPCSKCGKQTAWGSDEIPVICNDCHARGVHEVLGGE